MTTIGNTPFLHFTWCRVSITISLALILLAGNSQAEFAVSEFPPQSIDGPHRRNTELPLCNKLHVKACFSYDSPRGPSSAVWLVTAAPDVSIYEWFVNGIPNMPSTGWSGVPGLSFHPNNGTIRWTSGSSSPPISSGTRQLSFQVPALQLNPVTQNAVAPMVITHQVGNGARQMCRYPVRYPVISQPCEPRNCVVNAAVPPMFDCNKACASIPAAQATLGATKVISAAYPTTFTVPANGGSDCPTATTTCSCHPTNCVTGTVLASNVPTNSPDCNNPNVPSRTVWATATTTFAVATPAIFGGSCNSISNRDLVLECPCTAFPVDQKKCSECKLIGITSNLHGYHSTGTYECPQPTRVGCPALLPATQSCTVAIAPTDCVQNDAPTCPPYTCTNSKLPTSVTLSCIYPTKTPSAYGGKECSRDPVLSTVALAQKVSCTCCDFTSSVTNVNSGTSTITLFGRDECTSKINQQVNVTSCPTQNVESTEPCQVTRIIPPTASQGGSSSSGTSGNGNSSNWPDSYNGATSDGTCSGGQDYTGGADSVRCIGSWLQNRFSIFNAIFYGSINMPSGQVEGRLAVRGDVTLDSFSVGDRLPNANSACRTGTEDDVVLAVGGRLTYGSGSGGRVYGGIVVNRDKGTAGISSVVKNSLNSNCYVRTADSQVLASAFDAHRQAMRTMAAHLLTLAPTLSIKWDDVLWAWRVYRLRDSLTSYFDVLTFPQGVTSVNIGNWREVVDSILGSRTLIVNLPGVTISGNDYEPLRAIADRIVWNWGPDQTAVTITQVHLYGAVLAPSADITGTGTVSGLVVANSNAALSIQLAPFRGCVSAPGSGAAGGGSGPPSSGQGTTTIPITPSGPQAPSSLPPTPESCSLIPSFGSFKWDVLVFGNVEQHSSMRVDGRLAVGGSMTGKRLSIGSGLPSSADTLRCQTISLLIGGSPSCLEGSVFNGAVSVQSQYVHLVDPRVTAASDFSQCPVIGQNTNELRSLYDFTSASIYYKALSAKLYTARSTIRLEYTGYGSSTPNLAIVTPRPDCADKNVEVLNLTPSDNNIVGFANWEIVQQLFGQGKTLVINVPQGASLDIGDWSPLPTQRVIWNFGPDASVARVQVPLRGLVLAPSADLQGTSQLEGQVVVNSIKAAQSFSFALRPPFDGCVHAI